MSEIAPPNQPGGIDPTKMIQMTMEDIVLAEDLRVQQERQAADLDYADMVMRDAVRPVRKEQWHEYGRDVVVSVGAIACGVVLNSLLSALTGKKSNQ